MTHLPHDPSGAEQGHEPHAHPELDPLGQQGYYHPDSMLGHPSPASTELPAAPGHEGANQVPSHEIGDPGEYQPYWFAQEQNGYCVPSSVTEVIEAQTGITLHSFNLVETEAHHLGLPSTGLTLPQAQELLRSFDIPSEVSQAGTDAQSAVATLAHDLADGRSIILAVNASPIWYGSETAYNASGAPDHALLVTGINAETGVVTLSDPGTPAGNEEQVPLTTFLEAWSASDYAMLVTADPVGGADAVAASIAVHEVEEGNLSPAGTGPAPLPHLDIPKIPVPHPVVLLPVVLGLAAAGAAVAKNMGRRVKPSGQPSTKPTAPMRPARS
ncbi:MAG TPA: hypothetical protein VME46_13060 [Acidimicrobiales bacterium]|nr:hypothetical protein [Acidimicrobiales bacterium]